MKKLELELFALFSLLSFLISIFLFVIVWEGSWRLEKLERTQSKLVEEVCALSCLHSTDKLFELMEINGLPINASEYETLFEECFDTCLGYLR